MLSRLMTTKEQWVLLAVAGAITLGAVVLYVSREGKSDQPGVAAAKPEVQQAAATASPIPEPAPAQSSRNAEALTAPPAEPAEPKPIRVAIAGSVLSAGVYDMEPDARVQDLLDRAGGPTEEADLSDINRAARLIDGSTLTIPGKIEESGDDKPRLGSRHGAAMRPLNPSQYTISGWRPDAGTSPLPPGTGQAAASAATPGLQPVTPLSGALDLNTATQKQLEDLPGIGPKLAADIIRYRTTQPFRQVEDLTEVNGIGPKRLEAVRFLVTVAGQ